MQHHHNTQKGFTLFYAVLTASLLLAIGIAIFNITFKELILSSGARESANAFYAADTGLECALYWDLRHGGLSAPAFGFYGDSLASGLIGYWRFEDDTGSLIAVDSSGSGKTGTLINMDAGIAWTGGRIGDALSFDGVNDYVNILDANDPNIYTIAMWVRPVTTTARNIFVRTDASGPGTSWSHQLRLTAAGFFQHYLWDGGSRAVTGTTLVQPNTWYHVVLTAQNNGQMRLYVNGTAEGTPVGLGTMWRGGDRYYIGSNSNSLGYFSGLVDDVRIYNRVLSTTEIQNLSRPPYSNLQFVEPVVENSNAQCLGADITNPITGWDPVNGWNVSTTSTSATTTFDLLLPNNRCATVEVAKNTATTTVISRGYSSCDVGDPRRVERAIRATY